MAMERLEQRFDIVELIKSQRLFKLALRKLFTRPERMRLKMRTRYRYIDPDANLPSASAGTDATQLQGEKDKLRRLLSFGIKKRILDLSDGFFSGCSSHSDSIDLSQDKDENDNEQVEGDSDIHVDDYHSEEEPHASNDETNNNTSINGS